MGGNEDERTRKKSVKKAAKAKAKAKAKASVASPKGSPQASLTGEGSPAAAAPEVEAKASRESTPQHSRTPEVPEAAAVHENWEVLTAKLDGRKIPLQVPLHLKGNQRRDAFLTKNFAVPLFTAAALRDLARQYAEAHEEDALTAHLLRVATQTAQLNAAPSPASSEVASGSLVARATRESVITVALQAIKSLELSGKNNDPRVIHSWLQDLERALKRFSTMFISDDWPKTMCGFALLRLRGSLATVMSEHVDVTEGLTWKMFCDKVLKEFSPLDHQVKSIMSEVLAPCPTAHNGVIATQITQFKAGLFNTLGAEVIASLETRNPAFMCALVRHGLAASCPGALAKIVKSDHLVKYLASVEAAKATSGDESATPTGTQPWLKDLEILQRTVENNVAVKGNCIVVACSTCGGDHHRHRGGKPNCKLPAAAGARARDTIRGQAAKRWQDMDQRSKTLSHPQQNEHQKRRNQFVDKLAAISDTRTVEESDWVNPDQRMANTLQSYMSQKPKASGKGSGGARSAKRKSQGSTNNELAKAISAAVVAGISAEKKKKKKKSSKDSE